jgi:hypothetical protein
MSWRLIAFLLVCLVVAGCADSGGGSGSDNDNSTNRFTGFYGGMNGGGGMVH